MMNIGQTHRGFERISLGLMAIGGITPRGDCPRLKRIMTLFLGESSVVALRPWRLVHRFVSSLEFLRMMCMDLMRDGGSLSLDWADVPMDHSDGTDESSHRRPQRPTDDRPSVAEHRAPTTIVLQPKSLEGEAGHTFQQSLAQALNQADVILVDLIWIETTNSATIAPLLTAMQQAQRSGRSLSFLSMDAASQKALDQRWENDITASIGDRQEIFAPDFEQFLANYQTRKEATMLAVDIASKRQW
jgi:anti-anti-sigma regulatory factor